MKTLYTYIGLLLVALTVFSGCADENNEFLNIEEGNDVCLNISVQTQANKDVVVSRAAADEMLYDLHFYVFNAQGKLTGYEKMESSTGNLDSPEAENVTIRTKTGQSYIYAVANINHGSTYFLNDSDKNLLNVTTEVTENMADAELESIVSSSKLNRNDFLNIHFNRRYSAGEHQNFSPTPADNIFMMSGYLNDGHPVTIKKNSSGSVTIDKGDHIIKLYRILAKNTLTIYSKGNGQFTPKSYRLYNVPKSGTLVPNANISTANGANSDYISDIRSLEVESTYTLASSSTSFTFYYPENLQSIVAGIGTWKERESNSYAKDSKVFTNAPAHAAYIEIQGDYVSNDGKTTANTSYTIHLGNFSAQDRLGDFNVIRNNHYIYTVNVNDVEDIIAEAKIEKVAQENIDNPYAEGLVINATSGMHFSVDAHYEARVLKFTKSSIQALKASHPNQPGYILNIHTPFGKTAETVNVKSDGVYKMNNTKICDINAVSNASALFNGEIDFRWVKFVRNTTGNRIKSNSNIGAYTCKYPGDQWNKAAYESSTATEKPSKPWLNVFEFLAELYNTDTYTDLDEQNNSVAYYTCFIDENYYADKPWSAYVNKEPRTLQIANDLYISTDQKSVYAEVAYSISQRSIATFYTNENVMAYGTEIIDEEDVYSNRLGGSNSNAIYENMSILDQDDWDGWTSARSTNESVDINKGWYSHEIKGTDIVTMKENIQPLYKAVAKACMSRNRDLNGNSKIEADEVRWYLASVGQYRGLYLAQKVLPVDARLISDTELAEINEKYKNGGWNGDYNGHDFRGKYHYYTSSSNTNAGTFWPEEGLTNNPVQTSGWVSRAELVRCVRTLESNDNGTTDPELYYTYSSETRSFNLDGIKVNRAPIDTPLDIHNEIEDLNELTTGFVVAANDLSKTYSTASIADAKKSEDPCLEYNEEGDGGAKWRTPNQKEMALMLSVGSLANWSNETYATRTKFSGNHSGYYSWHNSPGFGSEKGSINLTNHDKAKVRCVRDKN